MICLLTAGHVRHPNTFSTSSAFATKQRHWVTTETTNFHRPDSKMQAPHQIGAAWRVFSRGASWCLVVRRDPSRALSF